MYDQRPPDTFSSPYGSGMQEETASDKMRYFWEDHGKKIIALVILLIIGWVAYDFFVGSYHSVNFSVKNTENENVSGASITITTVGETRAVYSGSPSAQSLKTGDYSVEANADGYRTGNQEFVVESDGETVTITLEKMLASKITATDFPSELYLGQSTTGTITLQNTGSKNETIELSFEGDFKELTSKGFAIETNPSSITVPGQQTIQVPVEITVPGSLVLKNKSTGDSKTGKIRLTYLNGPFTTVSFQLLPEPSLETKIVSPKNTVNAGTENAPLGKISLKNKGKVSIKNIQLSISLDASSTAQAEWFTFDTDSIDELGAGATREIQFYVSPPLNPNPVLVSGQSHVVVQSDTLEQSIPLNVTIQGVQASLQITHNIASQLSVNSEGSGYETVTGKKVTVKNTGSVTIPRIEIINFSAQCHDAWIFFDEEGIINNLAPGETNTISFRVTAPSTVPADFSQSCILKYQYLDPVSGEETDQITIDPVVYLKTTD
jgi:uncharacterized membrane protein